MNPVSKASGPRQEFHVRRKMRDELSLQTALFSVSGTVIFADLGETRRFAHDFQRFREATGHLDPGVRTGDIAAMGILDEAMHLMLAEHRRQRGRDDLAEVLHELEGNLGSEELDGFLRSFCAHFPPAAVYRREQTVDEYLASSVEGLSGRERTVEEMLVLTLTNENPACGRYGELFDDSDLRESDGYTKAGEVLERVYSSETVPDPEGDGTQISMLDLLRAPARLHPDSLEDQLSFIRDHWGSQLGILLDRILRSVDVIREETTARGAPGAPPPAEVYVYDDAETERFSPDTEWMPGVVMMAKSTLVWLYQLSERYDQEIRRLDQVPDEELDSLASSGFNTLWLIGLWERSPASRRIKHLSGNPDAEASAYALYSYDIAREIGGWQALEQLRSRCRVRGIRLASDMVPNHTGIDSPWVNDHPDWFVHLDSPPFPAYRFSGENLSGRDDTQAFIEDHYFDRSDAAVVFKHVDRAGRERYIYHGNDGTSMPWNDTAQLDYLKAEVREAVIGAILHVARNFPVIRFDAAMTLAKRHVRRLWYPEPGSGGAIASRSEYGLSSEEFEQLMPREFWREVVDRVAEEAPGTLLLAEAFWMMEGYFVRTLGMHRVYNSAFMNMLMREQNAEYREIIRNTMSFDPEILKRFVNFMNNPDEETAVVQFGAGDKYFAVATLLSTLPGLPMFGHGQVEGLAEKYGMEFRRPYWDEEPDREVMARHEREIFPLLRRRQLFASASAFRLYDLVASDGSVNENVYVYTNRDGNERVLVAGNNSYERASGTVREFAPTRAVGGNGTGDLSDELGATTRGDAFLLLREQRSGLWYIHRSEALRNDGLTMELTGFESRVFWEIHERIDESGELAKLEHDLHGEGVPDLDSALAGLSVRPVRERFVSTVTGELIDETAGALQGFKPLAAERFSEIRDSYRGALTAAVKESGSGSVARGINVLETHLSAAVSLPHQRGGRTENLTYKRARGRYYTGIRESAERRRLIAAWLYLVPLVDTVGPERALEWGAAAWPAGGHFQRQLQVMLRRMDADPELVSAREVMAGLLDDREVRELAGFNVHAGVEYYHLESMMDLLWDVFAARFLRLVATSPLGGKSVQESAATMFRLMQAATAAVENAGGRKDELLSALDQSATRQSRTAGRPSDNAPTRSSVSPSDPSESTGRES